MAFIVQNISRLNLCTRQILVHRSQVSHFVTATSLRVADSDDAALIHPPDDANIQIPKPKVHHGETADIKRARLIYQSRKRGMLENGILLSAFAARYISTMTDSQLTVYDKLINEPSNDWDIYYWAIGKTEVPEEYASDMMTLLMKFTKNEDNECRINQPPLY